MNKRFCHILTHCAGKIGNLWGGKRGNSSPNDKRRIKTNKFLAHYLFWLLQKARTTKNTKHFIINRSWCLGGNMGGIGISGISSSKAYSDRWAPVFSVVKRQHPTSVASCGFHRSFRIGRNIVYLGDLTRCLAVIGLW